MTHDPGVGEQNQTNQRDPAVEQIAQAVKNKPATQMVQEFQSQKNIVTELLREIHQDIEEVKHSHDLPQTVKNNQPRLAQANEAARIMQQTLLGLNTKRLTVASPQAESVIRRIVEVVRPDLHLLRAASTPFIYRLVEKAISNEFRSTADLLNGLEEIKNLQYVDSILYGQIVDKFKIEADANYSISNQEKTKFAQIKEALKNEHNTNPQNQTPEQRDQEAKRQAYDRDFGVTGEYASFFNNLQGSLEDKIRNSVRAEVQAEYRGKGLEESFINDMVDDQARRIYTAVTADLLDLQRLPSDVMFKWNRGQKPNVDDLIEGFMSGIDDYVKQGYLTGTERVLFRSYAKKMKDHLTNTEKLIAESAPGQLTQYISSYAGQPSEEGARIINAFESADRLKALLDLPEFRNEDGSIKFDKLWEGVQGVCEGILGVLDTHALEWFDQAFNPMYQGQAYNLFVRAVDAVGKEFSRKYPDLASQMVITKGISIENDPTAKGITGKPKISYEKKESAELGEAITGELVRRMDMFLRVNKYIHNVGKITQEGVGFETLAKYAEEIDTSEVDWFFQNDYELTEAYQFYIQSLKQTLYLDNRILSPGFGKPQGPYKLDGVQNNAFQRLLAVHRGSNMDRPNDLDQTRKSLLARKIRIASGLAAGYTGEFWGLMTTSQMPINQGESKTKFDENGLPKNEFQPQFKSIFNSGVERMLATIDPMFVWRRFNVPAWYPTIAYLFQDRHPGEPQSWNHAEVYKVREEIEDAYWRGASDYYLDFFKHKLTLGEFQRIKMIGMFARAGWRADEYKRFIEVVTPEGTTTTMYDFPKTMARLMDVGTFAVKQFIDNMSWGMIDDATKRTICGGTEVSESLFKEKCVEKFIFEYLLDVAPTKALGFERRQYTPRGESLVLDDVRAMLVEKYKGKLHPDLINHKLTPLFINAVEVASKLKLEKNKGHLQSNPGSSIDDFLHHVEHKAFTNADFNVDSTRIALRQLFDQFKATFGELVDYPGQSSLAFLQWEDFIGKDLIDFNNALHTSIHKNRAERAYKYDKATKKYETIGDNDKDKIDLAKRFSEWMEHGLIEYDIGGEDLDLSQFFIQAAGRRVVARYMGEGQNGVGKVNSNLEKLYIDGLSSIVKGKFEDAHALEKHVQQHIVPVLQECNRALVNVSKELGDEWVVRTVIFMNRAIEKDTNKAMAVVGNLVEMADRNWTGKESSLVGDYYPSTMERPTTSLNRDQSLAFMHSAMNGCDIPLTHQNIAAVGYKKVGIGPFQIDYPDTFETKRVQVGDKFVEVPVMETKEGEIGFGPFKRKYHYKARKMKKAAHNHWHQELGLESEGHGIKNRIADRIIPYASVILILIMLQLALAANKKNKK